MRNERTMKAMNLTNGVTHTSKLGRTKIQLVNSNSEYAIIKFSNREYSIVLKLKKLEVILCKEMCCKNGVVRSRSSYLDKTLTINDISFKLEKSPFNIYHEIVSQDKASIYFMETAAGLMINISADVQYKQKDKEDVPACHQLLYVLSMLDEGTLYDIFENVLVAMM